MRDVFIVTVAFSDRLSDEREPRESSLTQLLRTEQAAASKRYNEYGGGLVNPAQVFGQIPKKSKRPFTIQLTHAPLRRMAICFPCDDCNHV